MTEQPESLADLLRAAAGAMRREAERCEPWSPLAAAAWRLRAVRLRELADALPDAESLRVLAAVLDWTAQHAGGIGVAGEHRAAAGLLRALAGEEGERW